MFWTGFFIGFAACLAIGLTAHFVHDRRQRAAFIASLSPAERESRRSGATGTNFGTYCILTPVKRQQKITVGEMRQSGPTRLKPWNARALRGLWCRAGNGPHARRRLSICSETKQNDERLRLTLSIPAWADRNRNCPVDLSGSHYLAQET
jgi:hypothetical protein